MRRGFKKWAEEIAGAQRTGLGLAAFAPLSAFDLADHLDVVVIGPSDIPEMPRDTLECLLSEGAQSWSGTTFSIDGTTYLIHNTSHSPRRQESDVMHELSHLLCRHEPACIIPRGVLPITARTYNAVQEEEAAWLGGCLKLPREALLWAVHRGMSNEQIADYFSASTDLVRFRRGVTGVDLQVARRSVRL